MRNNICGTHVLLEACKVSSQVRMFIHVSTDEVYGETEEDVIVVNHEASQLFPTNPYLATKAAAEMLVMAYGEVGNVYNIGTKRERRVIDAAKDMSKLFNMDANASIMFVENRLFNDQRPLGGIPAILIGGGDVSGVMLPHPRMLMTPGEVDRLADGPDHTEFYVADPTINIAQIGLPTIKPTHVFNAAGVTSRPKIGVNLTRRKLSVPMSWAHST
uniref:Trifunctional UDP-glucose 4,6-dehydratase/UDP-4-keto-6-deoxy-D-glucose 3,5-epimerase/UDP-4-keto-L-rhamnose-reductase RHM1-like n=1 Tax=Tanacetum cinerariifolium TaxID=118510 RepID=A0A6L2NVD6_TANCI|nr:trifunctional UDP-glucose 4,6-dehydratase/UDP-4-keto-6-deoxy-D-glucose 3,5-epimerase/UDP-4-keto-L-rhamnose-reductase RHM1-like [Tanacetum cinerariifolium]